jgi:hypothetical protein
VAVSSAGAFSASPDVVADGDEGSGAQPCAGGAHDPDVVTVLEVKWLGGLLWGVKIAIPGLGIRRLIVTAEYANVNGIAFTAAALQALYTR